ncbi:hypothetical protein LAZ67_9002645 [Cordylochernes scorpioides]|uniref:Uncharacterized protein n=1 Tax=Cordylochernes scorpioides TaxID=51811 RepID=A0ABY6KTY3_9ARAC|nr:hypothetical protein LAZ67_9002645 [Cordylochernes scorpioides]
MAEQNPTTASSPTHVQWPHRAYVKVTVDIFGEARSVLGLTVALVAAVLAPLCLQGFRLDAELSSVNPQLSSGPGAIVHILGLTKIGDKEEWTFQQWVSRVLDFLALVKLDYSTAQTMVKYAWAGRSQRTLVEVRKDYDMQIDRTLSIAFPLERGVTSLSVGRSLGGGLEPSSGWSLFRAEPNNSLQVRHMSSGHTVHTSSCVTNSAPARQDLLTPLPLRLCMDIKNVRKWCREFNEGRINVHDEQRSGRPNLPESTVARIDEMVRANRRITLEEIEDGLNEDCSHFSVHKIVSETLGYRKVSARWVDKWLKEAAGEWYNTGITKLVDRMKKVIEHQGDYVEK